MVNKAIPHWWQQWLGIWFYGLTIGDLCQMDDEDLVPEGWEFDLLIFFCFPKDLLIFFCFPTFPLKSSETYLLTIGKGNDSWNLDWWILGFLGLLLTCS